MPKHGKKYQEAASAFDENTFTTWLKPSPS